MGVSTSLDTNEPLPTPKRTIPLELAAITGIVAEPGSKRAVVTF